MSVNIFDIIPVGDSVESAQNSEPSLAVNPNDPTQIIASSFAVDTPFFLTTDGGTTWSDYAILVNDDKSLAWKTDGSGFLASTLKPTTRVRNSYDIPTYSGTVSGSGFGAPINIFAPNRPDSLDQPWVRTGPSNHVYVAYNNLNNYGTALGQGKTASVNVSADGGNTFTPVVIDRVGQAAGGPGQDAPAVRLAVNGSTVYAVFVRWDSLVEDDTAGFRYQSHVVVVRSDNAGADSFTALGTGGIGSDVAQTIFPFSNTDNSSLTLGQERTGSDLAIAVDPSNPNHLVVAYEDAPGANGSGRLQLIVSESTDGGMTWITKFTTDSATRSAQPALAILADGTIGFLYDRYDPVSDRLSQHLLQTADDFATTSDTVLATESNATPVSIFDPYLGDFFDLEGIGNTFYGVFSASNADDGTKAQFSNVTFQRDFTGTPGTASFQLTDGSGNPVAASIDPFFFTATDIATPSPPNRLTLSPDSDSGVQGDNITNVTQPVITGIGEAGDNVTLFDSSTAVGSATAGSDGSWSITPTNVLAPGTHLLTASETDSAGNTSAASAALSLTIKTSAPPTPFGLALSPSSAGSAPVITGMGEIGDTVTLYADGTVDGTMPVGSGTVASDGTWSVITPSMSVGTHSLSAIETDDAGNSSTTSGPIAITVTAADPGPDGSPTPNWPSDTTISGGLIEIKSGASAGLISFSGGATLQLDDSAHFTGKISGFAVPDQLDLRDISFGAGTTINFAEFEDNTQGTLTVSDGAHVAQIVMAGQYATGQFNGASDGHGGTVMTDPPLTASATDLAGNSGAVAANGSSGFSVASVSSADLMLTAQPIPETFDFGGWMFGKDEITGFDPTQDAIRLSSGLVGSFASVRADMSAVGGATVNTFDASHSLTLGAVAPASLGAANFRFT